MDKEKMILMDALATQASDRSQEEIYDKIIQNIKQQYDGNVSNVEAHKAARNLIFCKSCNGSPPRSARNATKRFFL